MRCITGLSSILCQSIGSQAILTSNKYLSYSPALSLSCTVFRVMKRTFSSIHAYLPVVAYWTSLCSTLLVVQWASRQDKKGRTSAPALLSKLSKNQTPTAPVSYPLVYQSPLTFRVVILWAGLFFSLEIGKVTKSETMQDLFIKLSSWAQYLS